GIKTKTKEMQGDIECGEAPRIFMVFHFHGPSVSSGCSRSIANAQRSTLNVQRPSKRASAIGIVMSSELETSPTIKKMPPWGSAALGLTGRGCEGRLRLL